jgi:hypothetical protein
MRVIVLVLSLGLSSCALFEDMSPETLHRDWVQHSQQYVGQSIYRCLFGFCEGKKFPWEDSYLGETDLGNGFKERGFRYGRFDKENPNRFSQCRYYYKYEMATGLIVDFRFEESKPLACRFSGA